MENRYSRLHFYRRISLWIALLIAMFSIYLSSINNEINALDTFFYDQAVQQNLQPQTDLSEVAVIHGVRVTCVSSLEHKALTSMSANGCMHLWSLLRQVGLTSFRIKSCTWRANGANMARTLRTLGMPRHEAAIHKKFEQMLRNQCCDVSVLESSRRAHISRNISQKRFKSGHGM